MGMSSSQARLLTLTARMHDIEYKAQRIEAQKLQLANDSRRAYEDYLVALDAKKIQYRSIASDGSVTFRDATLNTLENGIISGYTGEHALKNLFIQNQEGKVMVTPSVATAFGLSESGIAMSLDDYIESFGYTKSERQVLIGQHWVGDGTVSDITSISNSVTAPGTITSINNDVTAPVAGVSGTELHPTSLDGFVPTPNETSTISSIANVDFNHLQTTPTVKDTSSMTNILNIDTGNLQSEYCISDIAGLKKLSELALTAGQYTYRDVTFYLSSEISELDMNGEDWDGTRLPNYANFDGNGVVIKNLGKNATVTAGLFSTVGDGASIKNVQLTNVDMNVTGTGSQNIGGLANSCSNKVTIDNCLVTGNIYGKNCSIGGIVGGISQSGTKIYNTNANLNITSEYSSADNEYGVWQYGVGGLIGIDSNVSDATHCFNCNVTGSITQKSEHVYLGSNYSHDYTKDVRYNVGGVVGGAHQTYAPDTNIENCIVTVDLRDDVNGGSIGGIVMGGQNDVFTDPTANQNIADNTHIYNVITDYSLNPGLQNTKHGNGNSNVVYDINGNAIKTTSVKDSSNVSTCPYVDSDFYKSGTVMGNLYAALVKAKGGDESLVNKNACITYMKNLYQYSLIGSMNPAYSNYSYSPGFEIANVNQQLYNYLTGNDTTGGAFMNALVAEIDDMSVNTYPTLEPTSYKDSAFFLYNTTDTFFVPKTTDATEMQEEQQAEEVEAQPGEVKVPAKQNIADVLYYNLINQGYNVNQNDVRSWVNTKYNSSTAEGMKQLADLTDAIGLGDFAGIYAKLSAGQAYLVSSSAYNTTDYNFSFKPSETITGGRGLVKLPTAQNIADMLYYNFKKAGKQVEQADVRNWVSTKYNASTQEGMSQLADLNNAIQSGNIEAIYSKYSAGQAYTLSTPSYPVADYDFEFLPAQTVNATEGGSYVNDYKTEKYWDTETYPEIRDLMSAWALGQRGVVIVTEEQASSIEYLKNMLEVGEAVLTTFDPNGAVQLQSMDMSAIAALTDEQYNEVMGIKNTSVSVDTSVREVADEKELKKAEAKYESDMRLIDRKDRKYDTELAAVETERNATKQEMETLKTVIKENGERTFKLFS